MLIFTVIYEFYIHYSIQYIVCFSHLIEYLVLTKMDERPACMCDTPGIFNVINLQYDKKQLLIGCDVGIQATCIFD